MNPANRLRLRRLFAAYFGAGALVGFVFTLFFVPHYLDGRRPFWVWLVAAAVGVVAGGAAVSQADAFWEGLFEGAPGAERRFRRWVVAALVVVGVMAAIGVFAVGRYGFPKITP